MRKLQVGLQKHTLPRFDLSGLLEFSESDHSEIRNPEAIPPKSQPPKSESPKSLSIGMERSPSSGNLGQSPQAIVR